MSSDFVRKESEEEDLRNFGATCRICRGESTLESPLFHPCKCRGSIKYIHESCLVDWVGSKNVDINRPGVEIKCDICHYPIQFQTVYDANMPERIPAWILIKKLFDGALKKIRFSVTIALAVLLLAIGVPLTWNMVGKLYTVLLYGGRLPVENSFWLSMLFGFKSNIPLKPTRAQIVFQLAKNYGFSLSQIVSVAAIHIALYFQYDMVVREAVFSKMVYHKIGPRYSREELMMEKLRQQFPGMDETTIQHIVNLMKVRNEQRGDLQMDHEQVPEQEPEPDLQAPQLNLREAEERVRNRENFILNNMRNDDDSDSDDENDSDFNTDNVSTGESTSEEENVVNAGDEEPGELDDAGPFEQILNRRAAHRFDELVDEGMQGNGAAPHQEPRVFAPAPVQREELPQEDVDAQEGLPNANQEQAIFSIEIRAENLPVYYIVSAVFVTIYLFLAYVIPTFVGYGLLRSIIFVSQSSLRSIRRLLQACGVPRLHGLLFKVPYLAHFSMALKPIEFLGWFEYLQEPWTPGNDISIIAQGVPALTTFLATIFVISASTEYLAKGHGPKNGMKNPNLRFIFQLFFAIRSSLKVFTLFAIELIGFPILSGIMVDYSLLSPLLKSQERSLLYGQQFSWGFFTCCLYWGAGTSYMYWFAKFVGMVRNYIIRPGVLFFIRSPDDPNIRILHDSLIHPMRVQISRLALSMLIYAIFIVVGFGFYTRYLFPVLLRSDVLPLTTNDAASSIEAGCLGAITLLANWFSDSLKSPRIWLRTFWIKVFDLSCQKLRLSSFILDKDIPMERGRILYRNNLYRFLAPTSAKWSNPELYSHPKTFSQACELLEENKSVHAYFIPDGTQMRVPANDIISRNYAQTLFVPVTKSDKLLKPLDLEFIREKNDQAAGEFGFLDEQSSEFDEYSVVYVPPRFRWRYSALITLIWLFASILIISLVFLFNFLGSCLFLAVQIPMTVLKGTSLHPITMTSSFAVRIPAILVGCFVFTVGLEFHQNRLEARAILNENIVNVHPEDGEVGDNDFEEGRMNIQDAQNIGEPFQNLFQGPAFNFFKVQLCTLFINFVKPQFVAYNYHFAYTLFFKLFVLKQDASQVSFGNPLPPALEFWTTSIKDFNFNSEELTEYLPLSVWLLFDLLRHVYRTTKWFRGRDGRDLRRNAWSYVEPDVVECLMTSGLSIVLQFFLCFLEYHQQNSPYTSLVSVYQFLAQRRFLTNEDPNIPWTLNQKAFYFVSPIVCSGFYFWKHYKSIDATIEKTLANIKEEVYGRGKTLTNLAEDN
ncbi:LAMI_0C04852g1_1 [Lachancea mirantina]|uniref:RING-type E3 ubiquitin transferase n=1 Tax=Lachancea mirantina TaxID=1230905 RepID=A0A1G4J2B2_9SACH|nr:LAMI_0C04852g1_1 [Lachancea mirantina]